MYIDPKSVITPDGNELIQATKTSETGVCPSDNEVFIYSSEITRAFPRGDFTLTANDTTTTVTNAKCKSTSIIVFMATTANAAGAVSTTYFTPGAGSFLVTHANNAQTDRTFGYAIL